MPCKMCPFWYNMHWMWNPFFWKKKKNQKIKNNTNLSFAEYAQSMVKVKYHDRDYQGPRLESITTLFYTYIPFWRFDKTNKIACSSAETQISLGIRPVWLFFAVRMKKAWVFNYPFKAQRRLIRLGGCPGWSESSRCANPFCWIWKEAAHLYCFSFV